MPCKLNFPSILLSSVKGLAFSLPTINSRVVIASCPVEEMILVVRVSDHHCIFLQVLLALLLLSLPLSLYFSFFLPVDLSLTSTVEQKFSSFLASLVHLISVHGNTGALQRGARGFLLECINAECILNNLLEKQKHESKT